MSEGAPPVEIHRRESNESPARGTKFFLQAALFSCAIARSSANPSAPENSCSECSYSEKTGFTGSRCFLRARSALSWDPPPLPALTKDER